jgi:hypothetical protein
MKNLLLSLDTVETTLTQRAASDFDYNDRHLLFNMTPNGPVILGGTKEKLTSLLTTPSVIEVRFTQEFLAVYHYFTTCQDVLESLWSAYFHTQIPTNIHENEKATYINKVRKRVVLVLIRWMENHPKDFYDANAILELTGLIGQIEDNDDKNRLMSLLKVCLSNNLSPPYLYLFSSWIECSICFHPF